MIPNGVLLLVPIALATSISKTTTKSRVRQVDSVWHESRWLTIVVLVGRERWVEFDSVDPDGADIDPAW